MRECLCAFSAVHVEDVVSLFVKDFFDGPVTHFTVCEPVVSGNGNGCVAACRRFVVVPAAHRCGDTDVVYSFVCDAVHAVTLHGI